MPRYRVNTGLSYPENPRANRENWRYKRVEPGEIVDDIPAQSREWLEAQGAITAVDSGAETEEGEDAEIRD